MKTVNYASMWNDFFNMSIEELKQIRIEQLDEENLDALTIKLEEIGEKETVIKVKQKMLESEKLNPAVDYSHIFEDIIVHYMNKKSYKKAIDLLYSYLKYDEKYLHSYRYAFIKRNIGFCYIASNKENKGWKIINRLISKQKNNYWNYYDLAFEFAYSKMFSHSHNIITKAIEVATKNKDINWVKIFDQLSNKIKKKLK